MTPQTATLRAALRRAPAAFFGLACLGTLLASLAWGAAWMAWSGANPPQPSWALWAPVGAMGWMVLASGLLHAQLQALRRPLPSRLLPGAAQALRSARHLPAWLAGVGLTLPALTVAVVHGSAWRVYGPGLAEHVLAPPWAWLLYTLGLAALAAGWGALQVVLEGGPWLRHLLGPYSWLMVLSLNAPQLLLRLRGPDLTVALSLIGVLGCGAGWWIWRRMPVTLSRPPAPPLRPPARLLALLARLLDDTTSTPATASPAAGTSAYARLRRLDPLLAPVPVHGTWGSWKAWLLAVAALLGWAWLAGYLRMGWQFQVYFVIWFSATTGAPWMSGVWLSPRAGLLPAAFQRRHLAWRVLLGLLRLGAAQTLLPLLGLVAAGALASRLAPGEALGAVLTGLGCMGFALSAAVASAPYSRQGWLRRAAPGLAAALHWLLGGLVGYLNSRLPAAQQWSLLQMAVPGLLVSWGVGAGLVAASARAWALYDWAHMPALPPAWHPPRTAAGAAG